MHPNGHSSATHLRHPLEGTEYDPTLAGNVPRAGWHVAAHGLQVPNLNADYEFVENDLSFRLSLQQGQFDPRRDLNDECGFPRDNSFVDPWRYQRLYERDALFARVIEVVPKECWAVQPKVYNSEDPTKVTPFEQDWDALGRNLRGGSSRYRNEEGSPVWSYLLRADVLSGIGRYGVLLFGLDDGLPLSEPAKGVEEFFSISTDKEGLSQITGPDGKPLYDAPVKLTGNERVPRYRITVNAEKTRGRKLMFLRAFPETQAPILRWETNQSSPRFGQPTVYQITFRDPFAAQSASGLGGVTPDVLTREVHWTRVLHLADTHHAASPDDFLAVPRGQQVLNDILTAQKPRWASGEGYFKSCIPIVVISSHPSLGANVRLNSNQLKDMTERVDNGMQKWIFLSGAGASPISPQPVDPWPFIEPCIKIICIKLNMPVRIFMGSERGELASGQDEGDWQAEKRGRNANYTIPSVIVPFVDRSIMLGLLTDPGEPKDVLQEETSIFGPDGTAGAAGQTEDEQAAPPSPPAAPPEEDERGRAFPEKRRFAANAQFQPRTPGAGEVDGKAAGAGPSGGIVPSGGVGPPPQGDNIKDYTNKVGSPAGRLTPVGGPGTPNLKYKTEGGYCVEWPDAETQSDKELADTAAAIAQADAAYIAGDNGQLMAPMDYLVRTRKFSEEEAAAILENAAARKEEMRAEQMQQQADQTAVQQEAIDKGLVPDPNNPDLVPDVVIGGGGPPQPPGKGGKPPGLGGGSPPRPGGPKKPPFPPRPSNNAGATNAFCATGEGGGVDPSCSPGGGGGGAGHDTPLDPNDAIEKVARAMEHTDELARWDGIGVASSYLPAGSVEKGHGVGQHLKDALAHVAQEEWDEAGKLLDRAVIDLEELDGELGAAAKKLQAQVKGARARMKKAEAGEFKVDKSHFKLAGGKTSKPATKAETKRHNEREFRNARYMAESAEGSLGMIAKPAASVGRALDYARDLAAHIRHQLHGGGHGKTRNRRAKT